MKFFFLFKGFRQTAARFDHSDTLNTDSVTLLVWLHYKLRLSSETVYDGIGTWNQSFVFCSLMISRCNMKLFYRHLWTTMFAFSRCWETCSYIKNEKHILCLCLQTAPTRCPVTWQQSVCFGQIETVLMPMIHFWCIYLLHWNICSDFVSWKRSSVLFWYCAYVRVWLKFRVYKGRRYVWSVIVINVD